MSILEKIQNAKISRRDFLKGTAAATAAVAGISLGGFATESKLAAVADSAAPVMHPAITNPDEGGKWVTGSCWHNCGGRCLNKVLVKDGIVVRQKTDDTHEDTPDFPQQRGCVRGRAERREILSPDRLKYPMKRKNWNPGDGEKHPELRGQDEWERLSWDEAVEMAADEIHRIMQTYGPESVVNCGGGELTMLLSKLGGCHTTWGTTSRGSYTDTPGLCGFYPQAQEGINDRLDLRKSDVIILHACNPAWSSAGNPAYHLLQIKKNNPNAEFICVDPFYNDSAALVGAKWVPCRPSTDIALLIGLAHTVYTMDAAGEDLMDWDFLNSKTLGFDQEHMPSDAEDGARCFKEYMLGEIDGVVKDAAWASAICGTSVEDIEFLAKKMSKQNKVAYLTAWAPARTNNSDSLPQMVMTLGAMTGHYGKSGHSWGVSAHSRNISGGWYMIGAGGAGNPSAKNPLPNNSINDTHIWNALREGEYIFNRGTEVVKVPIDVKMICWAKTAFLQTRTGATAGIEVLRTKPDFVMAQNFFLTTNAKYSDLVFPVTTPWEKSGEFLQGNREALVLATKVIEPLFESKSDQEVANLIAAKIFEKYGDCYADLTADPLYPLTQDQQLMNAACGAYYLAPFTKEKKTLITITKEEKAAYGVEGEDQEGVITWAEFLEKGLYQIPRSEGDGYDFIAFEDFVKGEATVPSASGLMEIYCQALKDHVNEMMFSEIEAYPTYIPPVDGYDQTWKDNVIGGEKGEFPLQVYNPHYLRRSHSDFDNVAVLREVWPNPVFLSKADAEAAGITDGDTVQITSPHGTVLRNACVSARFMPGVVGLPHGSWIDVDEKTGIDRGGADNTICGPVSTGAGVSGWNTGRCNIKKYDGEQLPADVERDDMQRRILF